MLSHLVYLSARQPHCTEEEIQKILASCKSNNSSLDITGVLLYSDTHFIQYLEGDYKSIMGLYDRIKSDDRHKNAVLISSSPVKERSFPSWQMGSKKFNDKSIDYLTDVADSEKALFKNILNGQEQEGNKTLSLVKKFFK